MPEPQQSGGNATHAYHPRIALVFDFDKTLSRDSLDELITHIGFDLEAFKKRVGKLQKQGWDQILAQFYTLIQISNDERYTTITKDVVETIGQDLELYPGVPELFDRVRGYATTMLDEVEVEFYVLTCGLIQMHRAHPVAKDFNDMWGSEFSFNEDGEIDFARQIITFPEKTHYLLQLAKGLGVKGPNEPADVYREVPDEEMHVPMSQILYIGDGASDMPSFQLMNEGGGLSLAVVDAKEIETWPGYEEMRSGRRVQNLANADYSEGSELLQSIQLAVESICKLIALRKLGKGE